MKPNTEQEALLTDLQRKNKEIRLFRIEMKERIERQLEVESALLLKEQSQIANRAYLAGVSKTRIGRAMGTTNWHTVNDVLSLSGPTQSATPEEVTAVRGEGWSYDKHAMVLTLEQFPSRRTGETIKRRVEVPLFVDDVTGKLFAVPGEIPRRVQTLDGDGGYVVDVIDRINIDLGLTAPPVLVTEPAVAPAFDYEESIRRAGESRAWEDEDDDE